MAFASSGCVVGGPPDYQNPQKTPPVLDLSSANPTLLTVITATTGASGTPPTTYTFTVNERSEDVGDDLIGLLYLDYGNKDNKVLQPGLWSSPASTFDNIRTVTIPWSAANQPLGCHTLTLEVTHASNVDLSTGVPVVTLPKDHSDDVAFATWWVDIGTDLNNLPALDCPTQSP